MPSEHNVNKSLALLPASARAIIGVNLNNFATTLAMNDFITFDYFFYFAGLISTFCRRELGIGKNIIVNYKL